METADDIISLWKGQLMEHAYILFRLLKKKKAPQLKQRALEQWQMWSQDLDPVMLIPMIDSLISLKADILIRLAAGEILGDIYPSVVEHMIEEANFFKNKLTGAISEGDEIQFWIKESAEHTGLMSHLLDPSEKELVNATKLMSDTIRTALPSKLERKNRIYNEALGDALDLNRDLTENKVKTVNNEISSLMLNHEIREALYGAKRLNDLRPFFA